MDSGVRRDDLKILAGSNSKKQNAEAEVHPAPALLI
jgi:hypothetical protein